MLSLVEERRVKRKKITYHSVSPFNGKKLQVFEDLSDTQLMYSIEAAVQSFAGWQATTLELRINIVTKAVAILRSRIDEFALPISLETGKLIADARAEIRQCAEFMECCISRAKGCWVPHYLSVRDLALETDCAGVIFGIQSWCSPCFELARFAVPNILAGNVVLVKPAPSVPQCAQVAERLWREAGAPLGVYSNLLISHEQSHQVIDDPRVSGIAFYGSASAGQLVAKHAQLLSKAALIEQANSDVFILLEDAGVDQAVSWAIGKECHEDAHSCQAAKRIIVVAPLADGFLVKLINTLAQLVPGDPLNVRTTQGPLATEAALIIVLNQIRNALAQGAKLLLGGKRFAGAGAFLQPTILTDITPESALFNEEIFGPVTLFFVVQNEEAAIAMANGFKGGFRCLLFTQDIQRSRRVGSELKVNVTCINHCI